MITYVRANAMTNGIRGCRAMIGSARTEKGKQMNDLISKSALLASTDKEEIHKYEIALFPTIDAVPVVLCEDCVNYRLDKAGNYCRHFGRLRMDDFFCAYGERSENGET